MASYLHRVRTTISLFSIGVQSKWWKKRGAFGISTRPHGARLDAGCKPDKVRKTDSLTRQLVDSGGTLLVDGAVGRMCGATLVACLILRMRASFGSPDLL
jgi:hypothetical protein